MKKTSSRVRGAFMHMAAAGAAVVLLAAQPAAAETPSTMAHYADINVTATHARIVAVHRARTATSYERKFDRVSDDGYDWAPVGYREVVRVVVEIADPRASRVDADERPQRLTFELDPSQLNAEQSAALSSRRMSQRIAPFHLNVARVSSTARRIDTSQSYLCSGDEFQCEDRLVFQDMPVERIELSVV